jgi:putative ABC transport system ATP-binding protein
MIKLDGITKVYNLGRRQLEVLKGVNIEVKKGEMVAIMGPSGSGKSTLLNILGCLDNPSGGSYVLDGKEVQALSAGELAQVRSQKIGFVFQSFNLLPHLSAIANVELGMRYVPGVTHQRQKALESLTTVGLADRVTHKPTELSGGEQQRVAVARAIAKRPPILLADEPTGNLDSKSGAEVMNLLTSLHTEQGITLVMITHDVDIAHYCQRIIHLRDGLVESEEVLP